MSTTANPMADMDTLTIEEVANLLSGCDYWQLTDEYTRQREFGWKLGGRDIAIGFHGAERDHVTGLPSAGYDFRFEGWDATDKLMGLGRTHDHQWN